MKIKQIFTPRKIAVLAVGALMIVAAILMVIFPNVDAFHPILSWASFACLVAGGIATILLVFVLDGKFAGVPAIIGSSIALAMFIAKSYMYIADAMYGVDAQWEGVYFVVLIPLVLALIGSIVAFFLASPMKRVVPKVLAVIGVILFPLLCVGDGIANEYASQINHVLGATGSKVEKIEGAEEIDSQYFKSAYDNIPDLLAAGEKVCESVEAEGAVLLKNNNALPLVEGKRKVSLFSTSSTTPILAGTGSGSVDTSTAPTLKSALEEGGLFSVNPTLWDYYDTGDGVAYRSTTGSTGRGTKGAKTIGEAPWADVEAKNGASFAQYGDAAIVVISRIGGEGSDEPRGTYSLSKMDDPDGLSGDTTNGEYLRLSPKEKELLLGLKAKKEAGVFSKVVVLLNFANQVQADFLVDESYGVDAALWIGTTGSTGFRAVAKILAGSVNPSGKLSTTFWADHHQNPVLPNMGPKVYEGSPDAYDSNGTMNPDRVYTVYQEGIYLGYRYTETRYEDFVVGRDKVGSFDYQKAVAYPFGYGLSYTNFTYSNFKVDKKGSGAKTVYEVSVDVKNTGSIAGKEVVQVYLNKPYTDYNAAHGIETSASELVGFAKTKTLEAGATENVKISVPERALASYDRNKAKTYVITAGDYYLSVGNGAHDALNNCLAKKGHSPATSGDKMDASGKAELCSHAYNYALDESTYTRHAKTNNPIHNLFDSADYNNYEHKAAGDEVKYITRSDWNGTVELDWSKHVILHYQDKLQEDLDKLGREGECALPEDKSAYPTMGKENGLQLINLRVDSEGNKIAYDDPIWDDFLDQLTFDQMTDIVRSGMRKSDAIESVGKPEVNDHNGPLGVTERFNYGESMGVGLACKYYNSKNSAEEKELLKKRPTCYPSSAILAASWNIDIAYDVGHAMSEDCLWVGLSGLYGPGSNIQRTPYSGRNFEYYSEDPILSGVVCGHQCSALESNGVYVYNKHFALNETEDMRRGISTWANEQAMREIYLRAFEIPVSMDGDIYVRDGREITLVGASGVMTAFNRIGLYWSGMSKNLMTDYARTEIGMKGIAVTDMWSGDATPYLNLPAMLVAGTNLIDGSRKATDLEMCKTNHADVAWGLRESLHRICYNVVHSNAMNGYSANVRIVKVREWWRNAILGLQIGSGALIVAGVTWEVIATVVKKKKPE